MAAVNRISVGKGMLRGSSRAPSLPERPGQQASRGRARQLVRACIGPSVPQGELSRRDLVGLVAGASALAAWSSASPSKAAVDPVATIKKGYASFGEYMQTGRYDGLASLIADDVVWITNVGGGYNGKSKADVKRFFEWVRQVNAVEVFEPVRFIPSGNSVATYVNMAGKGALTGKPYSTQIAHFFTFDDNGRITYFREYLDSAMLNEAFDNSKLPPTA